MSNFTFFRRAFVLSAAAGVLCSTACSSTDTPPVDEKTPRIELTDGTPDVTSLSFVASSWDAEKCAYVVIPADGEEPTAAEILQGGGKSLPMKA